jgi:hypothetical protein
MLLALIGLMAASSALAAPVTFFGEDLGGGEGVRLAAHPNADAARNAFFSNLSGVGTEYFDTFADGTVAPLIISFGAAGTAKIQGSGEVNSVPSGTNGVGRYPISGDNYWEGTNSFYIEFSDAIAAFGFYGIDIGDFDGQVTLTAIDGMTTTLLTVPNSINIAGGSVLYFGFYDTANQYTKITFGNTESGTDYFGFDNMTIGSLQQVQPNAVPEPTSLILLGTGLGAIGLAAWRKRQ